MKREAIGKKLRFEVFKRDAFTCQYCGEKAPDVVLHLDHVEPVSVGGTSDILNLLTSCSGCNLGKGARPLDDDLAVSKQRAQLEALQEKREQIGMMVEWQKSLMKMDTDTVEVLADFWASLGRGFDSAGDGFLLMEKILHIERAAIKEPYLRDALYIRGILRRRFPGSDVGWEAKNILLELLKLTHDPESEKEYAKSTDSYWAWKDGAIKQIADLKEGSE